MHATSSRFRRSRRSRLAIVIALAWVMVAIGASVFERHTARADGPPYTCVDPVSGLLLGSYVPCDSGTRPPGLLNAQQLSPGPQADARARLYAATIEQRRALDRLEAQAVENTLSRFGLPASDGDAVRAWARAEALVELWALIHQAINTPAGERTGDQQLAVEWLTTVAERQQQMVAEQAAFEYLRWAGLDPAPLRAVLAQPGGNANHDAIVNALAGDPHNYGAPFGNAGGWCNYQPPALYQEAYHGDAHQTCFAPCQGFGCGTPLPTFDEFKTWGNARINELLFAGEDFAVLSRDVIHAIAFGAAFLTAIFVATAGAAALTALLTGATVTGFVSALVALMPFAAAGNFGVAIASGTTLSAAAAGTIAAAVAGAVAVLIVAIALIVVGSIVIADSLKLPGKLAELITKASSDTVDLVADSNDGEKAAGLFSLIIGAATPLPASGLCDNSWLVTVGDTYSRPCRNPPPLPVPTAADPQFEVTREGSSTATMSPTITTADTLDGTVAETRVHGKWFVHDVVMRDGRTTVAQSLRLVYTDWSGTRRMASLVPDPVHGLVFASMEQPSGGIPTDCIADGNCALSPTIQYVGTGGLRYTARIVVADSGPPPEPAPVDTAPPTMELDGVPAVTNQRVKSIGINFTQAIIGEPTITLARDGVALPAALCEPNLAERCVPMRGGWLSDGDYWRWWDAYLVDTTTPGSYALTIDATGLRDKAGNPVTNPHQVITWTKLPPLSATIDYDDATRHATVTFNRPTHLEAQDLAVVRDGVHVPTPLEVTRASESGDSWTIAGLPARAGNYELRLGTPDHEPRTLVDHYGYSWPVTAATTYTVPLTTTITVSPAEPDGLNGYWTNPTITVTSNDPDADVRCTRPPAFQPASFDHMPECDGPQPVLTTGWVYAASRDRHGNQTPLVSRWLDVDTEPPIAEIRFGSATSPPGADPGTYYPGVTVVLRTDGTATRCVVDPTPTPTRYSDLPEQHCAQIDTLGTHTIYAGAIDQAGHTTLTSATITIVARPPQTTITPDPPTPNGDNGWYTSPVGLTIGADKPGTIRCVLAPASDPAPSDYADLPAQPCSLTSVGTDGDHVVYAAAIDDAGDAGPVSTLALHVDQTPADVTIGLDPQHPSGHNGFWTDAVGVSVDVDDDSAEVRCVLDPDTEPATFADLDDTCAIGPVRDDGEHTVWAITRDQAGNEHREHTAFTIDTTTPTASITLDSTSGRGGDGTFLGTVDVTASGNDALSGVAEVRCVIDPSAVPATFGELPRGSCTDAVAGDGNHTAYAASIDNAGNTSEMARVSFRIDTTNPIATIRLDPAVPDGAQGWYVHPVRVSVTRSERGTVRCVLDPAAVPARYEDLPNRPCTPLTVGSFGRHVVYAAVEDAAGHTSRVVKRSFKHIGRFACRGIPATHVGTPRDDLIIGTPGDDVIVALGGHDTIRAGGGDDIVCAGTGNDIVGGGPGDDDLRGGPGRDHLTGSTGADNMLGGSGGDILAGADGDDRIAGQAGNDVAFGAAGNDFIAGNGGNDRLFGGTGHDNLAGGAGNDLLVGGPGANQVNGGPGHNRTLTPTTGPH